MRVASLANAARQIWQYGRLGYWFSTACQPEGGRPYLIASAHSAGPGTGLGGSFLGLGDSFWSLGAHFWSPGADFWGPWG